MYKAVFHPGNHMRKSTKIFIGILVGLVILGILFRILASRQASNNTSGTNFDSSTTKFNRVVYTGRPFSPPVVLHDYLATFQIDSLDPYVQKAVSGGNFSPNPHYDFLYSSDTAQLDINTAEGVITYSTRYPTSVIDDGQTQPVGMTEEKAATNASRALESIFGVSADQMKITQMLFAKSDESAQYVDPEDASVAIVLFDYTLDDIPVINNFVGHSAARVILNSAYEVQSIELRPLRLSSTRQHEYSPLSVAEAIAQINQNNGFVANAISKDVTQVDLKNITSANLDAVQLEYFMLQGGGDNQPLIPYYRFSGTATNSRGQQFVVDILTPAIDQNNPLVQ